MNVSDITRLYSIFSNKRWHDNYGNDIVYTNFCNLLTNLTEDQIQLILDLAERYTWITYSEYQTRIINTFNKVEDEKLKALKKVYLFPIIKLKDQGKTKSSHQVLYLMRAFKQFLPRYDHIKFEELEFFKELDASKFDINKNEAIFLLDDYIGSGETIHETLEIILRNRKIELNHLHIITIAAQYEIYKFISELPISIYADHIDGKGISDYYSSPEREEKIRIMQEIERLIPGNHFRFGYQETEALITLTRTPDNTFPIFWKEHKRNNITFEAPFARYV
jgi:hypothetical protein